ncbi:MAG: hypothetical protein SNG47_05290, partial [Rikenellaceae bacterium]
YSAAGGGYLIIPEGEYAFMKVYMRSNIHIKVDESATLYPYLDPSTTPNASNGEMSYGNMLTFSPSSSNSKEEFVENCSISSLNGGRFTVDFRDVEYGTNQQVRFVMCRMVRNFYISDVDIQDNCTKYCPIIFSPSYNEEESPSWEISRPTDGVIKNCSVFNAASGYGMCQFHGALRLHFENLYSDGGIALRLEPDITANTHGVYDLTAENIRSENSRAAVSFSPHTAKNGTITIKNVWAKNCSAGVYIKSGFIDNQNADNPDATIGWFADDSTIDGIHVIYGESGQCDDKEIYIMEPDYDKYALFYHVYYGDLTETSNYRGPSVAVVFDDAYNPNAEAEGATSYTVTCTNITYEGFGESEPAVKYGWWEEIAARASDKWNIVKALPNYANY